MWIPRAVWEKMREDMTHQVQTQAGLSNRVDALRQTLDVLTKAIQDKKKKPAVKKKAKRR